MAEQTCPTCRGSGEVACQGCSGIGKRDGLKDWASCAKCHGRGTVTCPKCSGTGSS